METNLNYKGVGSVRDDVTKYLVDALFEKDDFKVKATKDGIKFKFPVGVGSKVSREFLLSTPEIPEFAWEPQTTRLLLHLAKNSKNVIVGGAYFGDQSIPIAKLIEKNNGVVHAFDLNEMQCNTLQENASLNHLKNIKSVHSGLWNDSNTYLNLSDTDDLAFATPSSDINKSNTITIDEYVEKNSLGSVDLIMLDIEGSEFNVLLGAKKQLGRPVEDSPNIIFEIHSSYVNWDKGLEETEIVKYLRSIGYEMFSIRDFQGNYDLSNKKIELIPLISTVLEGPKHGFNIVAVKNKELLQDDMFRYCENVSPKYIVHKSPALHHPIDGLK
ncbi:methyltransferase FkbM domain protein [Leptospira wolbachii serovar Codice str. CDC]|uniref:Methyltransferase FkbM domain protein n=1 Tax=Leptospira wolbachii serovar Codice str. CDC TaxID=1218599 RepID=R9A7D2_9LEPT|nr:FkbM family methyltransferase [Leptospira wolbachii]EOQ97919.1 methyltransferase FkbM domain protein [Leptospira wolbachii serovar Codice str. CDC]